MQDHFGLEVWATIYNKLAGGTTRRLNSRGEIGHRSGGNWLQIIQNEFGVVSKGILPISQDGKQIAYQRESGREAADRKYKFQRK